MTTYSAIEKLVEPAGYRAIAWKRHGHVSCPQLTSMEIRITFHC
jgi:hypothetical protein